MNEETPSTALTVTARAALALGSDKARAELAALVAKSANILAVTNAAGRDEAHGAAMALVRARTTITKTGKVAREDAAAFQKAVIAEEKALIAITQGEEDRLLALRDKWDADRAAEKAEAERLERERITLIHQRIAGIRAFADAALQAKTSKAVADLIERLMAEPTDGFEEFEEEGATARGLTLARMAEIHDTKLAEEKERARVAAEQEAERQRLAAERAELARQQAEAKAAQDRADAEAKARRDAEAAELAVERKKLADAKAAFDAEQAAAAARTATFLASVTVEDEPAPVVVTPPAAPVKSAPQRPTDVQIVEAIARAFNVPAPVALSWLIDFEVEAAIEAFEGVAA